MHKAMRLAIVAVTLVTLVVLTVAASALAVTSTNSRSLEGVHKRAIWDTTQVQIRRLTPVDKPGVNHTGYIHLELKFKPTTSDFDLYLLDSKGNVLSQEMGCMGIFAGKEFVDHQVTAVDNQTLAVYEDELSMVGDVYYVVIVAFNGTAEYQVWGYYPQIDLDTSYDVEEPYNYYLQQYRFPLSATSWKTLVGPRYGGPYDFRPTSVGEGVCQLQWPYDVVNKVTLYDRIGAPMPFNVEQYLYQGALWEEVLANWGTEENYLPDGQDGDTWYGFNDAYDVEEYSYLNVAKQFPLMHYVPSLFLAYDNALLGPDGGVKTGLWKMGFKATLYWPENLYIQKVAKYSTYYRVTGKYSLNKAPVPVGTSIEVQRKTATKGWATVRTTKTTDANGTWSVKLTPGVKWWVRAKAVGDPATGLDYEYSLTKILKAL